MKLLIIIVGVLIIGCNSVDNGSVDYESTEIIQKEERQINEAIQNGDLIFHTSKSNQSKAIQIATNSKYSHMGIIYKEGEEYFVYEAVQPVKFTKLIDWIDRGVKGNYTVKRVRNSDELLTKQGIQKMKMIGRKYLGKGYDLRFEWSDEKMYCSELVWKIYNKAFGIEIGKLEKIGDFDLSSSTVQNKVKERYGNEIPKAELVITPDRMFKSENLITIKEVNN